VGTADRNKVAAENTCNAPQTEGHWTFWGNRRYGQYTACKKPYVNPWGNGGGGLYRLEFVFLIPGKIQGK